MSFDPAHLRPGLAWLFGLGPLPGFSAAEKSAARKMHRALAETEMLLTAGKANEALARIRALLATVRAIEPPKEDVR